MLTRILVRLALFVAPFLLYYAWILIQRRRHPLADPVPDAPHVALILVGVALVVLSFLVLRITEPQPDLHPYVPPHLDPQGNIVGPTHTP